MALSDRSARWPWRDGRPPHLPLSGEVPRAFLLPGDPARVDMAGEVLDGFRIIGQNREFRAGMGSFQSVPVGVCSTGIGGASSEIAAVELAALGVRLLIRTGGMGALAEDLGLGDYLSVEAAITNSAVARFYAPGQAEVLADPVTAEAIDRARHERSLSGRKGRVATADGYYRAQGRPDHEDGAAAPGLLDRLAARGADGVEMECEVLLAVAAARGIRAGAILAVHGHRRSDGWLEDYEETQRNLLRVGALAASSLLRTRSV
ncbi:MAG: hypothetical protein RLO50_14995 [Azospirillaceae bacterium]